MMNEVLIGTTVLNLMFFLAGIDKIMNFQKVVDGFVNRLPIKNFPLFIYQLAIVCAIIIEIVAPLTILYASYKKNKTNDQHARYACYALILFTILATLVYHFPPIKSAKYYPFMSNLTTVGGLYLTSLHFK